MNRRALTLLALLLIGFGPASARQRTAESPSEPWVSALQNLVQSNPRWAGTLARTPQPHERASVGERFLYAATERGVARSVDGGRTWTVHAVAPNEPAVQTVVADGAIVWVGTHDGVFRSLDAGRTWSSAGLGMTATDVRILHRAQTGTLFAVTTPGRDACGLYRSRSDGNLWSCVAPGPEPMDFDTISEDPDGDIVVTGGATRFRTPDEGHSWTPTTPPVTDQAIAARFLSFGSR